MLAVHSDIPHETQLLAFAPTLPDQIKIVIATNAAESSVTIPDVDNVICCGTSKVLRYSERMHTTMLVNTWYEYALHCVRLYLFNLFCFVYWDDLRYDHCVVTS